jgi:hypothetical protein
VHPRPFFGWQIKGNDMDIGLVRMTLARAIAADGRAPSNDRLAQMVGTSVAEVEAGLRELAARNGLLLHPHICSPWAVHPFALAPGSCWVETEARGYWANCLYCAFGIVAALKCDASVFTRLGGESETVCFRIAGERVDNDDLLFHLSVPVAQWWDNVIFACSSFQPFRSEADIHAWCARHGFQVGATLTVPKLWEFAQSWYGGCLDHPWKQRSKRDVAAIFAAHGLNGPFWQV